MNSGAFDGAARGTARNLEGNGGGDAAETGTPFVVEHVRLRERPASAHFTPDARLIVSTGALRASGLLRAVGDGEFKALVALLSYLRPDGRCEANAPQIAAALGVGEGRARSRLDRLARAPRGNGAPLMPLVRRIDRASGLAGYVPSPGLLGERAAPEPHEPPEPHEAPRPMPRDAAGRAAVVARSRAAYAIPRAEAERLVAAQLGVGAAGVGEREDGQHDGEDAVLARRLRAAGIPAHRAAALAARYPADRIERQLDWLPYRRAKRPAAFLVAAVERDFGPPLALRVAAGGADSGEFNQQLIEMPHARQARQVQQAGPDDDDDRGDDAPGA